MGQTVKDAIVPLWVSKARVLLHEMSMIEAVPLEAYLLPEGHLDVLAAGYAKANGKSHVARRVLRRRLPRVPPPAARPSSRTLRFTMWTTFLPTPLPG